MKSRVRVNICDIDSAFVGKTQTATLTTLQKHLITSNPLKWRQDFDEAERKEVWCVHD